jgi:transposase
VPTGVILLKAYDYVIWEYINTSRYSMNLGMLFEVKNMTYYDKTFKEEALKLSDEIGTTKASQQLGISYFTISNWRRDRKKSGASLHTEVVTVQVQSHKNQREIDLEKENAELKKANEILKKALGFLQTPDTNKNKSALPVRPNSTVRKRRAILIGVQGDGSGYYLLRSQRSRLM